MKLMKLFLDKYYIEGVDFGDTKALFNVVLYR